VRRLGKLWDDLTVWTGQPGHRLLEYVLMAGYSGVAILAVFIGLTGKAGTLFGPAFEQSTYRARPEFRQIIEQLAIASGDFSAGVLLLIIGILSLWWTRRGKAGRRKVLDAPLPSGPPFLL
jgi:hypothetical protein